MKPASLISALFLCLVALGHVVRLALGLPVTVGTIGIPVWASLPAALFTGALGYFLWREGRAGQSVTTATPR